MPCNGVAVANGQINADIANIQKNDRLPPRSVVQLRNLVDQVKSLNFYGDEEIEQMIERVKIQVDQAAAERNLEQIQTNLQDIATITRASLIGLGQQPRQARALGVANEPTADLVRTARRGLGLDTSEQPAALSPNGRQPRLGQLQNNRELNPPEIMIQSL